MKRFVTSGCALALSTTAIAASIIYKAVDILHSHRPLPVLQELEALDVINSQVTDQAPFNLAGYRASTPNQTQWAVTYVPYTAQGFCKTNHEIGSDMIRVAHSGFTTVRLYSTDCDVLSSIMMPLRRHNLGVVIGVHISSDDSEALSEQVLDVATYGAWDTVEGIILGNEAVWTGQAAPRALAAFMQQIRAQLRRRGYKGPITTVEPLEVWQQYSDILCPQVDLVSSNLQPFFNDSVSASEAGRWVGGQLNLLDSVCDKGKIKAWNMETGWPSQGFTNGEAEPGEIQQEVALASIADVAGARSAFHGFENDAWKDHALDEFGVETHFGCMEAFAKFAHSQ